MSDLRVARNRARTLRADGDVAAAIRMIATASQVVLDDPDTTSIAWRLLAAAWLELGDRDTAHHYLEHGRARATTAEELCDLVGGYLAIGERAIAEHLIATAETVETGAWTMIAYTYEYVLGDLVRAHACIARGVRDVRSVDDGIAFAKLLPGPNWDTDPAIRDHLVRIGTFATNAGDWIALAAAYQTLTYEYFRTPPTAGVVCLDRALELATDASTRHQIAYWRHFWPEGEERGEVVIEPALAASEILRGVGRRAPGWRRDPARLFDLLRAQIDRPRLERIARHDDGDADDLVALEAMWTTGRIFYPLCFPHPADQLRWHSWGDGATCDHVGRAFACTILCIDVAGPDSGVYNDGNESAIPTLLESCIALGPDFVEGALELFAAMTDAYPGIDHSCGVLFAELGLVLAAAWRDPSDPRLAPLIARLIADERRFRDRGTSSYHIKDERFLLGLTSFDLRHGLWRSLAATILAHPLPHLEQLAILLDAQATRPVLLVPAPNP